MLTEKYLPKLHWFLRIVLISLAVLILYFIVGFFIPKILPVSHLSNISKYGLIFRNEKWSGEIKIVGDIWALPGTIVTINPGTKILVAERGDKFNVHFLPWLTWSGLNTGEERFGVRNGELFWDEGQKIQIHLAKLYALGTKQQPIIITSDVNYPGSPYDFNIFALDQGILSNVQMSNYRRLEIGDKVTIRDSYFKNAGECAVCISFANPSIINNIFENTLRQYIWIEGGNPKISDNLFMNAKGKGIVIDPKTYGSPLIYHNSFEMPQQTALEFLGGGEEQGGAVSFNYFSGGSAITIPCDSKVKFIQNKIIGTFKFARSGNCIGQFTLGPNYWDCSDKKAVLREKIINREPQFEVLLPIILTGPPEDLGRRPS
ncbi:MAG: right-handed parallel beta-helix repeat-containing protein [Candidatus Daviesbacteria bacterium]